MPGRSRLHALDTPHVIECIVVVVVVYLYVKMVITKIEKDLKKM